jgi:hypothetical protein
MLRRLKAVFFLLSFLILQSSPIAFAQAPGTPGVTNCGGDAGETKACLSDPAGIMKDSQKAKGFVQFANWTITAICAMFSVFYLKSAAAKLNDHQYKESVGPFSASFIAGAATFLAYKFIV